MSAPGGPEIKPGEERRIRIEIDTTHRKGSLNKSIAMVTNDPENLGPNLIMQAKVVEELALRPYTLNLGMLEAGREYKRWVKVANNSTRTIKVKNIRLRPEKMFSVEGDTAFSLAPGEERKVYVLFKSDEPSGRFYGMIVFETDLEYLPAKSIRAMAVVKKNSLENADAAPSQ